MKVEKVTLDNFRNYQEQEITFRDGLNVICGLNASGKTNLMESIFVAAIGRSPRTKNEKELIKIGEEKAYIHLSLEKKFRSHKINVEIDKAEGKKINIDGAKITRLGELIGLLTVVYFSPDELKMIKEAPQERRRFMDLSLSQENKPYYVALSKYNYLLAQRNKLMKSSDFAEFSQTAFIWETQMADAAADIIIKRRAFIEKIGKISDEYHRRIAGENEDIALLYEPCAEGADKEKIKENLLAKYEESHEKDYELGYTTVGVHREDFNITSKGIDLRKFGSQGQQRTAALVIKLAEIEYYYSESGEKPVLLLDDVLSELDERRRTALLEATKGTQTLITCTEFHENITAYHKIEINKGTLVNREIVTQKEGERLAE